MCRGDLSHGIWCQEHSCEAPAPPAPTAAPTAAPLGAPTMAPSAAPAADVPTPAAVVGNDPIFKAHRLTLTLTLTLALTLTLTLSLTAIPTATLTLTLNPTLALSLTRTLTIFKANGNVYKFHIKPGVRTPLLSWTAHQGWRDKEDFVKYELLGLTFKPRALKVEDMSILGDAQWFSQLTLLANEKVVLNVTRGIGGFGGMGIQVDGI